MAYVVTDACVKDFLCVDECSTAAIAPSAADAAAGTVSQVFINPDECIDCGVCEPECPPEAIKPDTENGLEKWMALNAEYSAKWPNISQKGEAPADREDFRAETGKLEKYFSEKPGKGS